MICKRNCIYQFGGVCGLKHCSSDATNRCPLMPDDSPEDMPYKSPMTNADHIRSMMDEELAWRMMQFNFCPPNIDEGKVCGDNANCYQCWVDWLKQPYKEEA